MRRIAHVSDLHFGRVAPGVLETLRRKLVQLAPHLVVVSGDLTQRARAWQFREARRYLDRLPKPQLVVPGNHDVPLYDVIRRFLFPLARYRRYISSELAPQFIDEEIAVFGVNTARSLVFKGGRVSEKQLAHVREKIDAAGGLVTIVVTHHPFMALEKLANCRIDVLLAGHLHATRVGHTADRYRIAGLSALMVQAGTATSSRTRAEPNSFNLLRVARARIEVDQYVLRGREFRRVSTEAFERGRGGWRRRGSQKAASA
jgi:predicted phosphodiesterase